MKLFFFINFPPWKIRKTIVQDCLANKFNKTMETTGSASSNDPLKMDTDQIDKWFEKGEWLNGWSVKPDPSINRKALALSYFRNREKWDKAFTFLKNTDVSTIEIRDMTLMENWHTRL